MFSLILPINNPAYGATEKQPVNEPVAEPGKKPLLNRPEGNKRKVKPPKEFIPSEKIGSDSSVAFPVDI